MKKSSKKTKSSSISSSVNGNGENSSKSTIKSETAVLSSPGQLLSARSVYESLKKNQKKSKVSVVTTKKLKSTQSTKKKKKKIEQLLQQAISSLVEASECTVTTKEPATSNKIDLPQEDMLEDVPIESSMNGERTDNGEKESNSPSQVVYPTLDKFEYHLINANEALVFIPFQTCFYFKGRLNLTVFSGIAEMHGYTMDQDLNKSHHVFSPRGCSLQCIRAVGRSRLSWPKHSSLVQTVSKAVELTEDVLKSKSSDNVLLIIRALNCNMVDYISRLFPINILNREDCVPNNWDNRSRSKLNHLCQQLDTSIILRGSVFSARFYLEPDVWTEYSQHLSAKAGNGEPIRLMVLGGKGVGKSTFLRFLVNQLLRQSPSVLVVDFDPGQPEFVPAGCVSASVTSQPLLGPNYAHLQQPLYSYFVGDADIVGCPERYVQSCRQLLNDCRMNLSLAKIPMIINTMGFTNGIGLDVNLDLIRFSQPLQLLQISSRSPRRNFPALLDWDFVTQNQRGWLSNGEECSEKLPEYELQVIYSSAELSEKSLEEWGFRPAQLRQLGLMSYFSQLSTGPKWTLMDSTPHVISFNQLAICICHESVPPGHTLAALNASLVALCQLDSETAASVSYYETTTGQYPKILREMPLMPCVGYGFVRAIDTSRGYIYLVTPEPAERLVHVNCLVMGGIRMPENLLLDESTTLQERPTADVDEKHVPYAIFGPSVTQPACLPYRKYNPVFTLRNAT